MTAGSNHSPRSDAEVAAELARPPGRSGKKRRRFPWPWRQEGRHFKLMLAVSIAVIVALPILLVSSSFLAAAALLLWLLTLTVQWLCIEPPDVEEKDLH